MSFTTNAPIFSPYDQWRQSFGLNPGDGAPLTDYDNDGIPNLLEYAFGLSPVTPSQAGLPAPQTAGTNFFFEFQRRLGTSGLEYTVQFSSNLTSWVDGCVYTDATSVTNSATMVQYGRTTNGPVETILVRSKQPLSGAASQFMRVNVLQP
jgi:hypothetical protein